MIITFDFKFSNPLPDQILILKALKELTGLNDIEFKESGNRKHIIFHSDFLKPVFSLFFDYDTNEITLWLKENRINYLMEATINVLKVLGGEYDFETSELAIKKWVDVKNSYQDRKLFPNED